MATFGVVTAVFALRRHDTPTAPSPCSDDELAALIVEKWSDDTAPSTWFMLLAGAAVVLPASSSLILGAVKLAELGGLDAADPTVVTELRSIGQAVAVGFRSSAALSLVGGGLVFIFLMLNGEQRRRSQAIRDLIQHLEPKGETFRRSARVAQMSLDLPRRRAAARAFLAGASGLTVAFLALTASAPLRASNALTNDELLWGTVLEMHRAVADRVPLPRSHGGRLLPAGPIVELDAAGASWDGEPVFVWADLTSESEAKPVAEVNRPALLFTDRRLPAHDVRRALARLKAVTGVHDFRWVTQRAVTTARTYTGLQVSLPSGPTAPDRVRLDAEGARFRGRTHPSWSDPDLFARLDPEEPIHFSVEVSAYVQAIIDFMNAIDSVCAAGRACSNPGRGVQFVWHEAVNPEAPSR